MPVGKVKTLCLLALGASAAFAGPAAGRQVPQAHQTVSVLGILVCSLVAGGDTGPAAQGRDVLCDFRQQGSEETYAGTVQGVGQIEVLFGKGAVILEVRAPAGTNAAPGLLQQVYSREASSAGAAAVPLTGETNRTIVLQPLAEEEGRVAAAKTRPDAAIVMLELKLKSSPA